MFRLVSKFADAAIFSAQARVTRLESADIESLRQVRSFTRQRRRHDIHHFVISGITSPRARTGVRVYTAVATKLRYLRFKSSVASRGGFAVVNPAVAREQHRWFLRTSVAHPFSSAHASLLIRTDATIARLRGKCRREYADSRVVIDKMQALPHDRGAVWVGLHSTVMMEYRVLRDKPQLSRSGDHKNPLYSSSLSISPISSKLRSFG
jgi:hypothetical protein